MERREYSPYILEGCSCRSYSHLMLNVTQSNMVAISFL